MAALVSSGDPLHDPRIGDIVKEQRAHMLLPNLPGEPQHLGRRGLTFVCQAVDRYQRNAVGLGEIFPSGSASSMDQGGGKRRLDI